MISKAPKTMTYEQTCREAFDANFDCVTNVYFEAGTSKLPFWEILSLPQYREALYKEYLAAPRKPNYRLYYRLYSASNLTQEERDVWDYKITSPNLSQAQVERKIRAQISEFETLLISGKFPKDCYLPNVWGTPLIAILSKVHKEYSIFKRSIFKKRTDNYREPEIRSEIILYELKKLHDPQLINDVIMNLCSAENIEMEIKHMVNLWHPPGRRDPQQERKDVEKWEARHSYFGHLLKKGLQPVESKAAAQPTKAPERITWLKDWEALQHLITQLEGAHLIPKGQGEAWAANAFADTGGKPLVDTTGSASPIVWNDSARLLGYLMECLQTFGFISHQTSLNKAIITHFLKKDGVPFPETIKQNRSGTGNNSGRGTGQKSKPKGADRIDPIIKSLKTLP